jgi:hypothetical protein
MNRLSGLFRPAAHVSMLPAEQVRQLYPRFRWRILESTFVGYATFYFVRNNLPVVSKEMGQALGYSKGQTGDMLAMTAGQGYRHPRRSLRMECRILWHSGFHAVGNSVALLDVEAETAGCRNAPARRGRSCGGSQGRRYMIFTTRNQRAPASLPHIGNGAVNTRTHSTETIFLRGN